MYSEILATNPLRTRADLQGAMRELWRPLRSFLEREGAAVSIGAGDAVYGAPATSVETFVRPLWGIAALVAGGGEFADGALCRRVLAEGVDPAGPRYWGEIGEHDQRAVEMGSLAAALWLAPGLLWDPLPAADRARVVSWLRQINHHALWDNNWLFFRVLVNGALQSVGAADDDGAARLAQDLARLDSFHRRDGWYADGPTPHFDYYIAMAMHLYGILYAKLSPAGSPHAAGFLARAARFAPDFANWFAADGSALPLGRSLTYRFAQGGFWGALALAGVEALPWGVIKRLHLQHLRWWLRQPVFTESGLLTIGYRYPNAIMAEGYNAPGSPYWAAKAFLPLALPASHPFWTADELPWSAPAIHAPSGRPGLVVCRDERRDHVFALTNNPVHPSRHRHAGQKYAKFAYSTAFGFNVPVGGIAPKDGAADNMLLVSDDGRDWRAREEFTSANLGGAVLFSRWSPWLDVTIDTWLAPALPGYVRVHRIRSARALRTYEGGFPLERQPAGMWTRLAAHCAVAGNPAACSATFDLGGTRTPEVLPLEPNTNLLHPLTVLPGLAGAIDAGESWLFTAVVGLPGAGRPDEAIAWGATLRVEMETVPLVRTDGGKAGGAPIVICEVPPGATR